MDEARNRSGEYRDQCSACYSLPSGPQLPVLACETLLIVIHKVSPRTKKRRHLIINKSIRTAKKINDSGEKEDNESTLTIRSAGD